MKTVKATLVALRGVATIRVGAVPATYLCFQAYLAVVFGFFILVAGNSAGLLLLVWGLAGFYGTLCLWAVAFGVVKRWSVAGLIAGTLAMLPFSGPYLDLDSPVSVGANPDALLYLGPTFVALAWLCTLLVQSLQTPASGAPDHVAG